MNRAEQFIQTILMQFFAYCQQKECKASHEALLVFLLEMDLIADHQMDATIDEGAKTEK